MKKIFNVKDYTDAYKGTYRICEKIDAPINETINIKFGDGDLIWHGCVVRQYKTKSLVYLY